ncbi:MAG: L-serine ammonia-lyase, iron-sulfur-dependent, subunit alpha [Sutterella parvirubra]|nr:L-serine ammonia-lyase, iron-sulfur-dependent, subunit alpha [Sutterella parvirubra]MDY5200694.1 L-serine ammonia-lyase, iron-sulfur-dependent, subunit alpha [Sutterella parvirubra]
MTTFDVYNAALADELLPAMGCTEPIALAYAGAICAKRLGGFPETIRVEVSRNIIKNVKSVVVPNTEGLRGIEAAVVAGLVSARPEAALEVLSGVTPDEKKEIHERLASQKMEVVPSDEPDVFFIRLTTTRAGKTVTVVIRTSHTNVTRIEEDGEAVFLKNDHAEEEEAPELWHISELIRAARTMPLDVSRPLLERQIAANMAIAEEGLKTPWGAGVGRVILSRNPEDPAVRARAWAAAASDARMNGCELPVVIVSGSGNQGITASVPVVIFAQSLKSSEEELLRAVLLSDLVTIALKQGIGKLSAYCGAVSAGCGAGAGIAMLKGYADNEIADVVSNALATTSGLICDGAKSSCAAKIAMSVEGALMALDMVAQEKVFREGDGIVLHTVDETAEAVGRIASRGMVTTDKEIIRVMLGL